MPLIVLKKLSFRIALGLMLLCASVDAVSAGMDFLFGAPRRRQAHGRRDAVTTPTVKPDARGSAIDGLPVPIARPPVKPAEPAPPVLPTPPAPPTPVAPTPAVTPQAPARPDASPGIAASGPVRQPVEDQSCLKRLAATNVVAEPIKIGPQADARCTVVDAVKLTSLKLADGSGVTFPDTPTLACATADTFAAYVRELLYPLSKGSYGTPIAKVWTGPGLECRSRDHVFGAKLSAHGQGLAVDIAQMALADGRIIAVGPPKTDADRAFETAARAAGCGYFNTALGPGSDAYHATHWHFDLEQRGGKGNGKFCQ